MEEETEENDVKENPRQKANPLSALTFWWLIPFFYRGCKTEYQSEDLFQVLKQHESDALGRKLQLAWECETRRTTEPSLCWTLAKVFGRRIIFYGFFFGILELIVKMMQPIAIGYLVTSYSPDLRNSSSQEIYTFSSIIVGSSIISVLIYFPTLMGLCHSALKMKVALASLIYRKSLQLSVNALDKTGGIGHVINLISSDVSRLDLMVIFIHNLWIGPLVTICATVIMYREIGATAFFGVVLVLMFIPFQAWLSKVSAKIHKQAAIKTDERLALMCEIIKGVQVIKMYAWEKPFSKIIIELRQREIQLIKYASFIKGVHIAFTVFRTRTAIFASILAFVLSGNILTAEKVFVVTACFNTMKRTMTDMFSYAIELLALARVSLHRIQRFLLLECSPVPTIEYFDTHMSNGKQNGGSNIMTVSNPYVVLCDVRTSLENEENFQLKGINLELRNTSLTAVIGPVGSGKTSLLNVILQEKKCFGKVEIRGKISYSSQEPWLFNQTLRKNIILAETFDEERYNNVLEVCALVDDLKSLQFGDKTWVGERGSTLSGGQKIRVNLARALYRKADIYLLDDPLSALDTHVANHVFEGIKRFLITKICVLVTHQHQFAAEVDHVVIINSGTITNQGSYEKLKDEIKDCVGMSNKNEESGCQNETNGDIEKKSSVVTNKERGKTGKVTWEVYKEYLKAFGHPCMVLIILFLFVLGQTSASSSDYFIGYWVNLEQAQHTNDSFEDGWFLVQDSCIFVYSGLNLLTVALTISSSFLFFNASMSAASRLHDDMFESVLHTKMTFFNQNQTGNIVNRFSKDLQNVDELIPSAAINCIQTTLSIIGIVVVVSTVQIWLLVPTGIAFGLLMMLRNVYIIVGSNLKRLEATTRSPMLSHVSASLQGLTTLRSSNILPKLQSEFDNIQNTHSTARYLVQASARMFAMWLETTCVMLLIFLVAGFLISDAKIYGGNVGLAITQVMGMMGLIQWAVRQSSDLEACMTSVERIMDYCDLDQEWNGSDGDLDDNWPDKGKIALKNVTFSYEDMDNAVLKDLNFVIQGGEKIGIVGRTGNGKTSIINALLQLYNTTGSILIDDIDVSCVPPEILRSAIGVIPQESVIFSGSVRMNLDPSNRCSDLDLWKVLELMEMKNCILELGGDLDTRLSSGGSNLSAGQRQLICAARAFLKDSKILVLDEPTSSLDPETERTLERALQAFSESRTVLTVAHRLEHVMQADKIMVVGDGAIIEFDEPHKLLGDETSYLTRLLQYDTNQKTACRLKHIAKQHYLEKHQNDIESKSEENK